MKNKLKNIPKFILFILFAKSMYFWTSEGPEIAFIEFITFDHNPILLLLFVEWSLNIIIKSTIMYTVAKRFGIIQFLNKFNFLTGLLFVCIMECLILYHYSSIFCGKTEIQDYGDIIALSVLGYGFLHTFLIYKIAKLYDRKHPAFFSRIKKLKNNIINKIPLLKQDLFWIIIYGILLLSIYHKSALGLNYWVFFYSGVLFFLITVICIIHNIVKNNKLNQKL